MKKYIKPIQKVFTVSTCNNILTGSPSDPIQIGNGDASDNMETKEEKNGAGIWDLY